MLEAANGYEAMELFQQHEDIALVFSDVMLPGELLNTVMATSCASDAPT